MNRRSQSNLSAQKKEQDQKSITGIHPKQAVTSQPIQRQGRIAKQIENTEKQVPPQKNQQEQIEERKDSKKQNSKKESKGKKDPRVEKSEVQNEEEFEKKFEHDTDQIINSDLKIPQNSAVRKDSLEPPRTPEPQRRSKSPSLKQLKIKPSAFVLKRAEDLFSVYDKGSMQEISEGAFAQVFQIKTKDGTKARALKQIKVTGKNENQKKMILSEIELHQNLDHPNIVQIYQVYQDNDFLYIILELLEGADLQTWIEKLRLKEKREPKDSELASIFYQSLLALSYAHSRQIIHRDVKLENIVLEEDKKYIQTAQLVDWGLSSYEEEIKGSSRGTPHYLAPENFVNECTQKSDVWAIGVCLMSIIMGELYFDSDERNEDKRMQEIQQKILTQQLDFSHQYFKDQQPEIIDLIQQLLERDPQKRIRASDALAHPYFAKNCPSFFFSQNSGETTVHQMNMFYFKDYQQMNALQKAVISFLAHNCGQQERNRLRESFLELDENKDGRLSMEEIKNGYQVMNMMQSKEEQETLQNIFDELDCDQSGFIDFNQFISACFNQRLNLKDEKLEEAFQTFDLDGNGFIEKKEIEKIFSVDESDENQTSWRDLIKDIDQNGDGQLQLQEFKVLMKQILEN